MSLKERRDEKSKLLTRSFKYLPEPFTTFPYAVISHKHTLEPHLPGWLLLIFVWMRLDLLCVCVLD